jgi:hypothetical protein
VIGLKELDLPLPRGKITRHLLEDLALTQVQKRRPNLL